MFHRRRRPGMRQDFCICAGVRRRFGINGIHLLPSTLLRPCASATARRTRGRQAKAMPTTSAFTNDSS
eukprot:scaffold279674_cov26-Tisochrysis_lutea.AAC.2